MMDLKILAELFNTQKNLTRYDNEIWIVDSVDRLGITFETIIKLSEESKYNDCTHTTEIDSAVLQGSAIHSATIIILELVLHVTKYN